MDEAPQEARPDADRARDAPRSAEARAAGLESQIPRSSDPAVEGLSRVVRKLAARLDGYQARAKAVLLERERERERRALESQHETERLQRLVAEGQRRAVELEALRQGARADAGPVPALALFRSLGSGRTVAFAAGAVVLGALLGRSLGDRPQPLDLAAAGPPTLANPASAATRARPAGAQSIVSAPASRGADLELPAAAVVPGPGGGSSGEPVALESVVVRPDAVVLRVSESVQPRAEFLLDPAVLLVSLPGAEMRLEKTYFEGNGRHIRGVRVYAAASGQRGLFVQIFLDRPATYRMAQGPQEVSVSFLFAEPEVPRARVRTGRP